MNRLTACLYLNLLPHIGAVRTLQLVRHCGSPEAVFDTQPERLFAEKFLNVATYKALCNWRSHEKDVAQLHDKLEANDWSYWLWDPQLPPLPKALPRCTINFVLQGKLEATSLARYKHCRHPPPYRLRKGTMYGTARRLNALPAHTRFGHGLWY